MKNLQTVACDFGNFELKSFDGVDKPRAIRSIHFKLPRGVNALRTHRNSPTVDVDGDRYHFGTQAGKYSSHEKTVIQNKELLARLHLYACLEPPDGSFRLIVAHHSPEVVENTLRRALMGKHDYIRSGEPCSITVKAVEVVPEGMGSYWAACQAGFIPATGHTIVIDIGGGSWLYRVVDSDGEIIAASVSDRMGSYALASQIAHDARLKEALRKFGITQPDVGVVLDGFRLGHTYAETGISWRDWLDEYLNPWFSSIFGTVKAELTAYLPFTRRFVVCGGGAHLIAHKLRGNDAFVVMPDPNYSNVLGMYERFTTAQLSIVA